MNTPIRRLTPDEANPRQSFYKPLHKRLSFWLTIAIALMLAATLWSAYA